MEQSFRLHNALRPLRPHGNQRQSEEPSPKPRGLWWGFGREWLEHLQRQKAEGGGVGRYNYRLELKSGAKLKVLSNWEEILAFSLEYGLKMHALSATLLSPVVPELMLESRDLQDNHLLRISDIDWRRVAEEFDGIEVTDYRRGRSRIYPDEHTGSRPFVQWLDLGWEISCGCLWRTEMIDSLDPVILPDLQLVATI